MKYPHRIISGILTPMAKKLFTVEEEKRTTNRIAGIALLVTYLILSFTIKLTDVYSYLIAIGGALAVGSVVYWIAEVIRKKQAK